mmetsp:Transcript_56076/g.167829  ORF Transcript_56076/g.167829 Transcript_56076/m.167829 type:complete len:210 (-) Transcript_56076:14-643(-)
MAAFHHGSTTKAEEAATRLIPTPPAFMEMRKTEPRLMGTVPASGEEPSASVGPPSSLLALPSPLVETEALNRSKASTLSFNVIFPSNRKVSTPLLLSGSLNKSSNPRNCEKTRTLLPGSTFHTSSSSARTASILEEVPPRRPDRRASRAAEEPGSSALTLPNFPPPPLPIRLLVKNPVRGFPPSSGRAESVMILDASTQVWHTGHSPSS